MTLFDGKPLTWYEVRSRMMCECGHTRGEHRDDRKCLHLPSCNADCEEFKERAA